MLRAVGSTETRRFEFGIWDLFGISKFEFRDSPLRAPIQWTAGEWHQVALVWSGARPTVLYLDGQPVASGVGLDLTALEQLPGTPGFCVGSDRHPPDAMGAVGPNHFVELLNNKIAVYDNVTGQLVAEPSDTRAFFHVNEAFPTGQVMVDPRIVYDHQAGRWVTCALESGSTNVGLAISITNSPLPLDGEGWRKYEIPFLISTNKPVDTPDFPTLGIDAHGIYISASYPDSLRNRLVAIDKGQAYSGPATLAGILWSFDISSADYLRIIQPAVNFDPTPLGNLVWLITKGPPQTSGNYLGGALLYRRLQWSNGNVAWKPRDGDTWHEVADPPSFAYRDYFDLDGGSIGAPQLGRPTTIALGPTGNAVGSRLSMAVIRDGALWTCHHVGVDGVDGDYDGNETGSTVDRSAIQWFRLHITETGDLHLQNSNDRGRIWDSRASRIAQPLPVGRYRTSGYAYGVDVAGSYAYVADGEAGLQVIDVSNPTNPILVGGYDTSGSARGHRRFLGYLDRNDPK